MSKLDITVKETSERMVKSLIEVSKTEGYDLNLLDCSSSSSLLSSIDDNWDSSGQVRCENFCDEAWEYSAQFGNLGDNDFENAQHRCIDCAIKLLKKEIEKEKIREDFSSVKIECDSKISNQLKQIIEEGSKKLKLDPKTILETINLKEIEYGSITDEELDSYAKFSDYEKEIIKKAYSMYPKGFFPNPYCALR